jgi:cyclic pyranopterin phosphate synthase
VGYEVNAGRIDTWALEAHVVDHCNLRCADCCTGSPGLAERFTAVDALARDLEHAAAVLRPAVFKLTGGEPLLHPEIVACLQAARASGVAARISLTTNGFLLADAPDALFAGLDAITLSRYTSAPLAGKILGRIRARAGEHGVHLREKVIGRFQVVDGAGDVGTFARCWMRHRCHMVHAGRFYACTRPPHLGLPDDGVELPARLASLLGYLERDEPLEACRGCLGGDGPWLAHRQLPVLRGDGKAPA